MFLKRKHKRREMSIIEEQNNLLKVQLNELEILNQVIIIQKEEIENQCNELLSQNEYYILQNLDLIDSIEYAKRIQTAAMPSKEFINSILPEHFILFMPRDIVSGDFYWMAKKKDKIIIAAGDCTGHGVPGALLSILGITMLNEIVNVKNVTKPNMILNMLRDSVKLTLSQKGRIGEVRDGMDIALCTIDFQARIIEFSGAYSPMYIVRNGELIEVKADKMPAGIHIKEKESFTLNVIDFKKNDCIYLFSDGYKSQFGGEFGRSYMVTQFKKILPIIAEKPMGKQLEFLEQELEEWRGYNCQVDDILVIGIKIN